MTKITIGQVYYFGYRRTPNVVTRVIPLENDSQLIAYIELKGPRGGTSRAYVRKDGSCRKI
jgi:hypothetical protein